MVQAGTPIAVGIGMKKAQIEALLKALNFPCSANAQIQAWPAGVTRLTR